MKSTTFALSALLGLGAALYSVPSVRADEVTIMGDVVRYEPGRTIVIKNVEGKEMTYTLSHDITMPTDVAVGRHVMLYTGAGVDGGTVVTRVTTSMTPEGDVKKTVEKTHTSPSGVVTKTKTTTVTGTVKAFESGRSITITRDGGEDVTYLISPKSVLPAGVAVGKVVTVSPMLIEGSTEPAVKTVTFTKTKVDKDGDTKTKTTTTTTTEKP